MSSQLRRGSEEDGRVFKWGKKKEVGGKKKNLQFYESFTIAGVEYFLYDCVCCFCATDLVEASIGKLVSIYESPTLGKRVKVVWFFRPSDIRNFLGDYEPRWNEVFLASGEGKGLSNVTALDSIVQKCNVVCTSRDERNPQPSEQELRMADYIFCKTFDVGKFRILEKFGNHIDGIKVENFFNKGKAQKLIDLQILKPNMKDLNGKSQVSEKSDSCSTNDGKSGSSSPMFKESNKAAPSMGVGGHMSSEKNTLKCRNLINNGGLWPGRTSCNQYDRKTNSMRFSMNQLPPNASEEKAQPCKRRKLLLDVEEDKVSDNAGLRLELYGGVTTVNKLMHVSGRQDLDKRKCSSQIDKSKWFNFKQLPWEERLQRAQEEGTLVSLENLDPFFTSSEVEELLWLALHERVEAKMIQHSAFSSPHYGNALIIFKSKDAALSAISKLQSECLMVADGRPVVGRRGTLRVSGKHSSLDGHLVIINKQRPVKQSEEKRKAVSTAHCSQPNNMEYDMAIEWQILQMKSDVWWEELHKCQGKEIENVRNLLKMESYK